MAGREIQVDHRSIVYVRGQRVMLDAHLAVLYGVPTKALVQAVQRNKSRFPLDFMFRLTLEEAALEVTVCDLKFGPGLGRSAHPTVRLH
jgi:hypothetical protein